ncbi:hypothetical protein [Atopomonas hussainii]|uniref:hypothetical protein n=1 Tax=Atopomonas hussainii TaxID=1429083 RepID=UPI0009003D74|nr:hypothetical protein [Atopomonas hussainii]
MKRILAGVKWGLGIAALVAAPYFAVEYNIYQATRLCVLDNCPPKASEHAATAQLMAEKLYPSLSTKLAEITQLRAKILLAGSQRNPALRREALTALYNVSHFDISSAESQQYVLEAMRGANALGEYSLAQIFYADYRKQSAAISNKQPNAILELEAIFSSMMELLHYQKVRAASDVSQLNADIARRQLDHTQQVEALCAEKHQLCGFATARMHLFDCLISASPEGAQGGACWRKTMDNLAEQGIQLVPDAVDFLTTLACLPPASDATCTTTAQMLEPYYGSLLGLHFY